MIERVGSEKTVDGKIKRFSYIHVNYDKNGWADATKYLPANYDLVLLKLENGKFCNGWLNVNTWDGLHLKPTDKVLYWRRKLEDV